MFLIRVLNTSMVSFNCQCYLLATFSKNVVELIRKTVFKKQLTGTFYWIHFENFIFLHRDTVTFSNIFFALLRTRYESYKLDLPGTGDLFARGEIKSFPRLLFYLYYCAGYSLMFKFFLFILVTGWDS